MKYESRFDSLEKGLLEIKILFENHLSHHQEELSKTQSILKIKMQLLLSALTLVGSFAGSILSRWVLN